MHSPWSLVAGARNLNTLTVKKSSMTPIIGEEFRQQVSETLLFLTLEHTGTSTIEPGSMTHLKNLGLMSFYGMPFKTFPRSALPDELPNLTGIFITWVSPYDKKVVVLRGSHRSHRCHCDIAVILPCPEFVIDICDIPVMILLQWDAYVTYKR